MTEVDRICLAALERPIGERAAFLADACRGGEVLRRELESLLAQLAGLSGLGIGQHIGPYRIELGAEGPRPTRREVDSMPDGEHVTGVLLGGSESLLPQINNVLN